MRELGLAGNASAYREDHLVPLCAGGHPSDEKNLLSDNLAFAGSLSGRLLPLAIMLPVPD